MIHFGPMLYAGQSSDDVWRFYVGLLVDEGDAVALEVAGKAVALEKVVRSLPKLGARGPTRFVRFLVELARGDEERAVAYRVTAGAVVKDIEGVRVPARGTWPRLMFFSCNGFDDPKRILKVDDVQAVWSQIWQRQHIAGKDPDRQHHVCIGGGDQVYCDSLFFTDAMLRAWRELPKALRIASEPTEDERLRILEGYVDIYTTRWWSSEGRPTCGDVFSRVPCAFTWDDHDIFDGWGSHDEELQRGPVHQAMYAHARTCFELFQRGGVDGAPSGHHLSTHRFGTLAVVLTDSRSHRTPTQVLGEVQLHDLRLALRDLKGCTHVIVVTAVPVIYRGFGVAESVLRLLPGVQELEDDLRDQWESPAHAGERRDLLLLLLEEAKRGRFRATLVSGDVHVGSRGQCTSTKPAHLLKGESETVIHQITSSAVVFPPPSWEQLAGLAVIDQKPRQVQTGVETALVDVAPPRAYLIERNWLSITPLSGERLRLRFMGERGPSTEIIVHAREE